MTFNPTVYSFSRLTTFHTCKHAFNEKYNNGYVEGDNAWSIGGGFAHDIIEGVLKKEIPAENAAHIWATQLPPLEFATMKHTYVEKYITEIHEFFKTFVGVNDEIIAVEKHFETDIDGIRFQGHIDLLSRGENQAIKITDWKTSGMGEFTGKKLKAKARQLYLYSEGVKEEYGEYPKELCFHMIKYNKEIKIDFNMKDLQEAKDWLRATVEQIESETEWEKNHQPFWCQNLCAVRTCEFNRGFRQ
jgi:hypothetical protein